jgi:hypothetical protein
MYNHLVNTSLDLNDLGFDIYTGHGTINISLLIENLSDTIIPNITIQDNSLVITDNVGIFSVLINDNLFINYNKSNLLTFNFDSINKSSAILVIDLAGNIL